MNRAPSRPAWKRLMPFALLIGGLVYLLAGSPADARIDLLKKAKDKAAKAAGARATGEKPSSAASAADAEVHYDDVVVELTEARVQRIVAGYRKAQEASAGRPALMERLNKANDERSKFAEKHWEAIQEIRQKRSDAEICYHDGYREARDRRMQEYSQKAVTDPKILEKYRRVAEENNAAAARGDSTRTGKVTQAFEELTALTRADSLEVSRKCGPVPARLPEEDKLDTLESQVASLQGSVRDMDEEIAQAQADDAGLNSQQWGMARDRLWAYFAWRDANGGSKSAPRGFSGDELKAFENHLQDLRAAIR
jgi:hypothetical protein